MDQRIEAVFENGVFRPDVPLNIPEGERVSLKIESESSATDDLSDVADLLDFEFLESCRKSAGSAPTIEEVQKLLSTFQGSLADRISEERDER